MRKITKLQLTSQILPIHDRGIVFIFLQGPSTHHRQMSTLLQAMAIARRKTGLPICIATDEVLAKEIGNRADYLYIAKPDTSISYLRIIMSKWVPFANWLYLDSDVQVTGNSHDFGFSVLQRGFDLALCSIMCEADKSCAGDSATFSTLHTLRSDISFFAFYPQLGISYHRRTEALERFESHWWAVHNTFAPCLDKVQPSFAAAFHDIGHEIQLYVLPPHFNCRKGFREIQNGKELPQSPFPRQRVQFRHDRNWMSEDIGIFPKDPQK